MVAEAVYNLPWYHESITFRKIIFHFLLLLQRPCQVVGLYYIKMEIRLSIVTLHHMYSVLSVILSLIR